MQARAGKENHDAWPRLARLPETNSRMRQKGRQTSKSFMGTPEAARAGRRGLRAQNGSGNGVLASKAAACGKRRRCVCSCAFHGARHSPPCIHPEAQGLSKGCASPGMASTAASPVLGPKAPRPIAYSHRRRLYCLAPVLGLPVLAPRVLASPVPARGARSTTRPRAASGA